jgi:hypothetical protein
MRKYNCYDYAKELGFTEEEARSLQASKMGKGQDATVLRRLAIAKGLPSMKPKYPVSHPETEEEARDPSKPEVTTEVKPPAKRKRKAKTKTTKA